MGARGDAGSIPDNMRSDFSRLREIRPRRTESAVARTAGTKGERAAVLLFFFPSLPPSALRVLAFFIPRGDLFTVIFPGAERAIRRGPAGGRERQAEAPEERRHGGEIRRGGPGSTSSTAKGGFIDLFMERINGPVTRIYIPLVS